VKREYKELIVFLIASGGLFAITREGIAIFLFMFGVIWNWAYHSQMLRERAKERKYALSFIRFFFFYNDMFTVVDSPNAALFMRMIPLAIPTIFLYLAFGPNEPMYLSLVGIFAYQSYRHFIPLKVNQ
jgi:hypothetical protein